MKVFAVFEWVYWSWNEISLELKKMSQPTPKVNAHKFLRVLVRFSSLILDYVIRYLFKSKYSIYTMINVTLRAVLKSRVLIWMCNSSLEPSWHTNGRVEDLFYTFTVIWNNFWKWPILFYQETDSKTLLKIFLLSSIGIYCISKIAKGTWTNFQRVKLNFCKVVIR